MDGYVEVSLKNMLSELGEDRVKAMLSDFSCPMNIDVELFLKSKAIYFDNSSIAPTHLVFTQYQNRMVLIGYYTITLKSFFISKKTLSKIMVKRISKFGTYNSARNGYEIPAPLIAQLGKNFNKNYNKLISGDELLKMALDRVSMLQQIGGGKMVYIECEDKTKLLEFYSSNGFVNFGERTLDRDEHKTLEGNYLIQMFRYL